jgi:CRP/FNR family transcriptional regulator
MSRTVKEHEFARISLFRRLTPLQANEIASRLQGRVLGAKKMLFARGQTGSGVYFLRRGLVKICVPSLGREAGREAILNICGRGEVLGEMDAMSGNGHSANVITLDHSDFWWMPTACFRACVARYPELNASLNEILVERLQRLSAKDCAQATLTLEGRLARQMLLLARDHGVQTRTGVAMPVGLSQRDLAALVGSTREQINRILSSFRRRGLLRPNADGHLVIRDCEALSACCAECTDCLSLIQPLCHSEEATDHA